MRGEELEDMGFRPHASGLWVNEYGEVFVPKNGSNPEHFTFGYKAPNGYMRVGKDGKLYLVHRLVAECFIPNPENKPCVDHIDTNPSNCVKSNIRWVSAKENNNNPLSIENQRNAAKKKTVLQYTLDGEFVKEWSSTQECGRNGFKQSNVWACCKGKLKKHRGYIWKYKEGEAV